MKLTTRTRYGTRLMISLALNFGESPVRLKEISESLNISEKYLSQIVIPLRGAGLIRATRGAYGGYSLARQPSQISLKEVVDILEGGSMLVDCIDNPSICDRVSNCVSRDLWLIIDEKISATLSSITLETLVKMSHAKSAAFPN